MTHGDFKIRPVKHSGPLAALLRVAPLLVLLLLPEMLTPDEAHAAVDYGYALLATLGAVGAFSYLATRLSSPLDFPPIPGGVGLSHAPDAVGATPGEDWPLLVALVFGALIVLLAGLGGWVYSPAR